MRPVINITFPEPFIKLDEYCRRFDIPVSTAKDMIRDGRLPIKKKIGQRDIVFVNMVALTMEALNHHSVKVEMQ